MGELLDFNGKILITGVYDGFTDMGNGYIAAKNYNKNTYRINFRIYNLNTQNFLPNEYSNVEKFSEGMAAVQIDGKYGYINEKGEMVIPAIYEYANVFKMGEANVKKGSKYFYIDKTGQAVKKK